MKTTNNTVLITGGSAGIGLAMARLFVANGNRVIITGRNEERLQAAAAELENVTAIVCDVNSEADVQRLTDRVQRDFPELNILINNAGTAYAYTLSAGSLAAEKAKDEMLTNYFSVIHLTEKLLPVLQRAAEAAIVNVSSIVAFVPSSGVPTYSGSKAALHSYTQSLRLSLAGSPVKVFELMPPLVNTEFSRAIGGEHGIPAGVVAEELLQALQTGVYEIHVGQTADIYQLSRSAPAEALLAMNSSIH